MFSRYASIVVGGWLVLSGFLWPHAAAELANACTCGLLAATFAGIALSHPAARWLNTALAVWLVISTLALRNSPSATIWTQLLSALVIYVASLVPEPEWDRIPARREQRALP